MYTVTDIGFSVVRSNVYRDFHCARELNADDACAPKAAIDCRLDGACDIEAIRHARPRIG